MLFIPGWKLKVNKEKLEIFELNLQFSQSITSINYYVLNGDHNANFPFGIFIYENRYYIILGKDEPRDKNCFIIGSNLVSIENQNNDINIEDVTEGLEAYIKTFLDLKFPILFPEYISSTLVKTYLGQYSKGRISKRKMPLDFIEFFFPYKVKFNLCDAEEFAVIQIEKNEFLLSYVPRFEIFDNILQLPQNEYTKNHIFDKWKERMNLSTNVVVDRFNELDKKIMLIPNNFPFIEILNQNIIINDEQLPYPIMSFDGKQLENSSDRGFTQLFFENIFLENLAKTKIKINILLDLTAENKLSIDLKTFIKEMQEYFDIEKMILLQNNNLEKEEKIFFEEFDQISINIESLDNINHFENIIFILNDIEPGSEFLYRSFKNTYKKVNKVLRIKTILDEPNKKILLGLIYIGILYRATKKIPYKIKSDNPTYPIIAISKQINFDYKYNFLILSYVNKENEISLRRKLIPYIEFKNENGELSEQIESFLLDQLNQLKEIYQNQKIIIYFKDIFDLKSNLINTIKINKLNDFYLVCEHDIGIKLFKIINYSTNSSNKMELNIPPNGTYFEINTNNHGNLIFLLTNGIPDNPNNGTPNPVAFEIEESISKNDKETIINSIYTQSFIHPTSFSKSNSPIEYYIFSKMYELPIIAKINSESFNIL